MTYVIALQFFQADSQIADSLVSETIGKFYMNKLLLSVHGERDD